MICFIPMLTLAQGNKGNTTNCAPVINNKICYTDTEFCKDKTKQEIYSAVHRWANKNYSKDIFISNVSANKNRGTIFISSKIELLLNKKETTILKYKMLITCFEGKYTIKVNDLSYQYDPLDEKKFKVYSAEDIILNKGKSNKIALIKNPKLFCDATFFFIENLFNEINEAVEND